VERREKIIVGVNEFTSDEAPRIDTLYIGSDVGAKQKVSLRAVRESRNQPAVQQALQELRRAASGEDNLMPHFMTCVREYATLGEICDVLRSVFGTYVEPIF
jgi:methylmalonyl-CoA mutase, N-terminal domain